MLTGLVLAGGRSVRMGHDKASLVLADGRTLLQRQVEELRSTGVARVFVAVRPGGALDLPGVRWVEDGIEQAGPMAGLAAGLQASPPGLVLALAVDMPGVTSVHLRQLLAQATPDEGAVPVIGGQIEPLAGIYPAGLAASANAWLASGQRSVQAWVRSEVAKESLRLWETPPGWATAFRSWNTPADAADGSARL